MLLEALHAKDLAPLARDARETVDRVTVAQHFERFAQKNERRPLGVVDPALGGAAHVDHEHHRDVAFGLVAFDEQPLRQLHPRAHVGVGRNHRVKIDVVAVFLPLEPFILAAQELERAAQLRHLRRILGERRIDKSGIAGMHVEFAQHAPLLAVMPALIVPLVVERRAFLVVGPLPHRRRLVFRRAIFAIAAVAGGHQVLVGNPAQVLGDGLQQIVYVIGGRYRLAVKPEFNAVIGIRRLAGGDGVTRLGGGTGLRVVGGRFFGKHIRKLGLQLFFFPRHARGAHGLRKVRVQCPHIG